MRKVRMTVEKVEPREPGANVPSMATVSIENLKDASGDLWSKEAVFEVPVAFLDLVELLSVPDDRRVAIEYGGGMRYVLYAEEYPAGETRDPGSTGHDAKAAAASRAYGEPEKKDGTTQAPAKANPAGTTQVGNYPGAQSGMRDSQETKK